MQTSTASEVYLGNLVNYFHQIGGAVYAVNCTTLRINGFTYDGTGPAVYWYAGRTATPDETGLIPEFWVVHNSQRSETMRQLVLGRPYRNEEIVIRLPGRLPVTELR